MVQTGELAPCEFINVESEFAAMSVAIGASAAGARAYTATASQGLLYMVEALYNASGLGLPIVMTVANRAIGAPINIWNDHSDSMSQRDSGWIQLYAETNQEALDLHIQAFRLAEELSLPVMVCMDGFILTHAYERVDVPDAGAGRRLPAAVRAAPGARPRRPGHDRRDGRPGGVLRGQVPHARQADAGARPRSPRSPPTSRGVRPRLGRAGARLPREDAETVVVALGSVLGTIEDVVDELRDEGVAIGARRDQVLPALPARRGARGARPRRARGRAREGVRRRRRRHRRPERAARAVGAALRRSTTWSPASGGRPITKASLHRLLADALAGPARAADLPRPGLGARRARAARASRRSAARARTPRTCCATSGSSPPAH